MNFPIQVFSWTDIPLVFLILLIEILLAADNSAALAMVIKKLPEEQKKKALFTGVLSAFILRAIGVIFTVYLIKLFWLQILGGLYLLYIAWKHLFHSKKQESTLQPSTFWKSVLYIELLDILFAIDSILGAFAIASLYYPFDVIASKLWVIYLGGIMGVLLIRIVTQKLIKVLDKYKGLERVIFLVIGWMGIKLIFEGIFFFLPNGLLKHSMDLFFWLGTIAVVVIGFLSTKLHKKT